MNSWLKNIQSKWDILMWGQIVLLRNKNKKKIKREVKNIKYEKTVSKCKKMWSFIQNVVKRNTIIIYQKEYDDVSMEYEYIAKEYSITKGNDATLYEVWNV